MYVCLTVGEISLKIVTFFVFCFFFLMIRRPPRSTLSLHDALPIYPSLQIVESDQPIYSIWLRNMPGMEHHEIPNQGETVLVRRLAQQVEELLLPAGGTQFFAMIQSGHTLGQSAERIIDAGHGAELSDLIRIALESSVQLSLFSAAKPTAS